MIHCYQSMSLDSLPRLFALLTQYSQAFFPDSTDTKLPSHVRIPNTILMLIWDYSRTPLLRPPLGLAIGGRNRGVAVIQALEHVVTCVYVAKTHV